MEVEIQGAEYDSDQICRTRLPRDLSSASSPPQPPPSPASSNTSPTSGSGVGAGAGAGGSAGPTPAGNIAIAANGFNPVWNQRSIFEILNPQLALIRFAVYDDDSSAFGGGSVLVAQAAFPVSAPALAVASDTAATGEPQWTCALRPGFRSVPLYSPLGERIELASLLVYIDSYNPKVSSFSSPCLLLRIRNFQADF